MSLIQKIKSLGISAIAGVLLVIAAVIAFTWANSPFAESYHAIWTNLFTIGIGEFALSKPIILWINDALMAVFFLLVGLEIKREVISGALSDRRKAMLPILAAVGGIVVPALIYSGVNFGGEQSGWAIPAATDIAFALGILALLGKRVPVELKIFLTAVAVVDDLGAILIIAAFFTESISWGAIGVAAGAMVLLTGLNRSDVQKPIPYLIVGAILWVAVLKSGIHATVAGVLLAMAIPAGQRLTPDAFLIRLRGLVPKDDDEGTGNIAPESYVHNVREICDDVESPMLRWEHALTPYVLLGIMPIFAFANAGVSVVGSSTGLGPVGFGVMFGLLLGKPIGIMLGAFIGVKLGLCDLPKSLSWGHLHGAAWLGGIGFTMSLFIANLSLTGDAASAAKLGLLIGSVIAGVIGAIVLVRVTRTDQNTSFSNPNG